MTAQHTESIRVGAWGKVGRGVTCRVCSSLSPALGQAAPDTLFCPAFRHCVSHTFLEYEHEPTIHPL